MNELNVIPDFKDLSIEQLKEIALKARDDLSKLYPHIKAIKDNNNMTRRFLQCFEEYNKFILLVGANRSGKTTAGCYKAIDIACRGSQPMNIPVTNTGWIVSLTFDVQREVIQPKLESMLPKKCKPVERGRGIWDYIIIPGSRSKIVMKSCEMGEKAFQGSSINWLWFDEEPPYDIWSEATMRLTDTGGPAWVTMTSLLGITDFIKEFLQNFPNNNIPHKIVTGTIDDNKDNLPALEIEINKSRYKGWESEARLYGKILPLGGVKYFAYETVEKIREQIQKYKNKILSYDIFNNQLKPSNNGIIKSIYNLNGSIPELYNPHIIAADIGSGIENGDYTSIVCFDTKKLCVSAIIYSIIDPVDAAGYIHILSKLFPNYLSAVETNNHGLTTIQELIRLGVKQYRRRSETNIARTWTQSLGWLTTLKTRPLVLDSLRELLSYNINNDETFLCPYEEFITELNTFVFNEDKNRPEAAKGYHDDFIMSLAIASHLRYEVREQKEKRKISRRYLFSLLNGGEWQDDNPI